MNYTATYSPEDNKLRLYAIDRLDTETYKRVKAAGFIWAPKQGLFVAPMWTPNREDLLLELAGEIGDEDTTLVDRAEERAERFEDYKESRIEDAERADKAVRRIADNIPFGQPILIGHHSERHARKDAERIQNGMRKTVQMWQTARYWEERAAGALRHAKYKELPGVRHRRIKGLQADQRKQQRHIDECEKFLRLWADECAAIKRRDGAETTFLDRARMLAGQDHISKVFTLSEFPRPEGASTYEGMMSLYSALGDDERPGFITPEQARDIAVRVHERSIARAQRWLDHYTNRIAYERAMLDEQGGMVSHRFTIEVGGAVLIGGYWLTVLRVNKGASGDVNSLTTSPLPGLSGRVRSTSAFFKVESVKDYRAPQPGDVEKAKAAKKLPPLCNYPGEGFASMTQAEWDKKHKDYKTTRKIEATATHGLHRVRYAFVSGGNYKYVFITDAKRVDPPALTPDTPETPQLTSERVSIVHSLDVDPDVEASRSLYAASPNDPRIPSYQELSQMKAAVKEGVAVVVVPQLFPTPGHLAARMVALAGIEPGDRVSEPEVGTGAILRELVNHPDIEIVAVEINGPVLDAVKRSFLDVPGVTFKHADFLECNGDLGTFDKIVMNPPFANGEDIKHISHALKMLRPKGRCVALCANGPRQNDRLKPVVEAMGGTWEELPSDTFASAGTSVRTVLLTVDAPQVTLGNAATYAELSL